MTRADAFLTGRVTFEHMRGNWPAQTNDPTGADDVRRVKDSTGGEIVCTGSVDITHQLIAADLVDEFRLFVCPAVVGNRPPPVPRRHRRSR
jgi:dihydrofolate reductase